MSAESRYRFLLHAYPAALRAERGDEMLDVLLAVERRRGRWSAVPEAASLVGHGLAARFRQSVAVRVPPSFGVAGVALTLLLAVLGTTILTQMGLRVLRLDGYPVEWKVWRVWVDPRWPLAVAWIATALALLLRRYRLAVGLAWTAVVLGGWMVVSEVVTGRDIPWIGSIGPDWGVVASRNLLSWVALTPVAALLLGAPGRARRGVESRSTALWRAVLVAGAAGAAVSAVAGPLAIRHDTAFEHYRLTGGLAGPLPAVLLAAVTAVVVLARSPYGRGAVAHLALAGLVPVLARWSDPAAVLLAGGALFAVGYVVGTRRRPAT